MNILINGFGRIGKLFFLAAHEKKVKDNFIINDITSPEYIQYSLQYDSSQPLKNNKISYKKPYLLFNNKKVLLLNIKNPEEYNWKSLNIDIVVDCTGLFTKAEQAKIHLKAGAKKVLLSAPGKGHDKTLVYDVNNLDLKKTDKIISAGSCTTNCAAPMLKILDDNFKIEKAQFITTHAFTSTQRIIDGFDKKDFKRGRSASTSIIPSTSGASISVIEALPQLKGKLSGYALRVPVPTGSITSIITTVKKTTSPEKINEVFKKASESSMKNILSYNQNQIVSQDIVHDPSSCIFDSTLTSIQGNMVSIAGWYDNEWGYSNRLVDVLNLIRKTL